ncbi:hypothetical protein ABDD95_20120 [Mucilaginibacter sp. PAMB04274]|uniref:hypothetical protein n=1 Tax=Mucilaginibacter sp. PAMB04274 TaxID=3138568 RepID=UPI0031F67D01
MKNHIFKDVEIMRYYLDTNVVYNIKRIPDEKLTSSLISILTLIELVSGIQDPKSYQRRKSIVSQIFVRKMIIDWGMPEEIIFDSFDIFEDYEFKDDRRQWLMNLLIALKDSENYVEYCASAAYVNVYGHAYFKAIDDEMNMMFVLRSMMGNAFIKDSLNANPESNSMTVDGVKYKLNTLKELKAFFDRFPERNHAVTINALAAMMAKKVPEKVFPVEDIFETYNGLINPYVSAMSQYSIIKVCNHDLPAKNDFSDLTHLLYFKDFGGRKLVSDDRIFKMLLGDNVISFAEFLA